MYCCVILCRINKIAEQIDRNLPSADFRSERKE